MAGAETVYTFATRAPIWLAFGRDNVTKLPVYRSGAIVTPDSGTYALRDIGGHTVSAPSVSFDSDGIATATVPGADIPASLGLGEGYSELWTLEIDGVSRTSRRDAVLGRIELHPPVAQSDLVSGEYPDILDDVSGFAGDLQSYMDQAWSYVCRIMTKRGDFPDTVVEPSDVYDWYRQEVFERIFRSLFKSQNNDRMFTLWQHHKSEAQREREGLRMKVDRDRDGVADSLAREPGSRSVFPNLPPRRWTRNPKW
jgi:hypothetical protein